MYLMEKRRFPRLEKGGGKTFLYGRGGGEKIPQLAVLNKPEADCRKGQGLVNKSLAAERGFASFPFQKTFARGDAVKKIQRPDGRAPGPPGPLRLRRIIPAGPGLQPPRFPAVGTANDFKPRHRGGGG